MFTVMLRSLTELHDGAHRVLDQIYVTCGGTLMPFAMIVFSATIYALYTIFPVPS